MIGNFLWWMFLQRTVFLERCHILRFCHTEKNYLLNKRILLQVTILWEENSRNELFAMLGISISLSCHLDANAFDLIGLPKNTLQFDYMLKGVTLLLKLSSDDEMKSKCTLFGMWFQAEHEDMIYETMWKFSEMVEGSLTKEELSRPVKLQRAKSKGEYCKSYRPGFTGCMEVSFVILWGVKGRWIKRFSPQVSCVYYQYFVHCNVYRILQSLRILQCLDQGCPTWGASFGVLSNNI